MWILYDLIFLVFALCYLPVFLLKKKMHPGFSMRLGILPKGMVFNRPAWLHAVSVGEAMSVRHLVEHIRWQLPGTRFVISTVTATGNKVAWSIAKSEDAVIYLPLDFSFIVKKVISAIDPAVFIIAETEIWPNLISCLYTRGVPIIVVNGRISDRSLPGYWLVRFFIRPLLNKVTLFCVQTELDARRLKILGVSEDKIKVTGNMKFDIQVRDYEELRKDYTDYRVKLGLGVKERLMIAASTHPGEEETVVDIYRTVVKDRPEFKLLIAPRHPERGSDIEKDINRFEELKAVRISQLAQEKNAEFFRQGPGGKSSVFILDTIGQLMYFYAIADIVFVGGSLVKKGGHNILEPASLGKPILFGPHMFNFRAIAGLFLDGRAAVEVRSRDELEKAVKELLADPAGCAQRGRASRELIIKNQGATKRNGQEIIAVLKNKSGGIIK